jgi:hypothetical protein
MKAKMKFFTVAAVVALAIPVLLIGCEQVTEVLEEVEEFLGFGTVEVEVPLALEPNGDNPGGSDNPGGNDNLGGNDNPAVMDWEALLEEIEANGKFVQVDLNTIKFNMQNGVFDPGTITKGKKYITSLVLPDAATSIKNGSLDWTPSYKLYTTFHDFTNLKSVKGKNVETIGEYAFINCTNLTTADFPAATVIGYQSFTQCASLTTVKLSKATVISESAFAECTKLTKADLPEATKIDRYAFNGCASLATAYLPKATEIGDTAFASCTSLTKADLAAATKIGSNAFSKCYSLAELDIPAATEIGEKAFQRTRGAALTVTLGSTPPKLGSLLFYDEDSVSKSVTLKVPAGAKTAYENNTTWQTNFKSGGYTVNITLTIN